MDGLADFGVGQAVGSPLSQSQKAAAILIAMGKPVAGKLLKFFALSELQTIIGCAQSLRSVPPQELEEIVSEFEDLFTEGAGLMDNAQAMQGILEEGLPPEEVDGLLGRNREIGGSEMSIWDQIQEIEPAQIGRFLNDEHPQTIAYVVSKLPPTFAAKTLVELPKELRANIVHRVVNMKPVNPNIADIIEQRVGQMLNVMESEQNSAVTGRVAEMMNEMDKPVVDELMGDLETISSADVARVKPKIFLFDDILEMPTRSRVTLFNDLENDTITLALRGLEGDVKEAVLSSLSARTRRMIEADLSDGAGNVTARDIAVARRSIAQEAIRLASLDQITLKDDEQVEAA